MKNLFGHFVILFCLPVFFPGMVFAEEKTPEAGGMLTDLSLPMPSSDAHRSYLGLSGKDPFVLSETKRDLLVIQIFSMYCPHCQQEAPAVNRLYERMAKHEKLGNKVGMIGIGAGNSEFEVEFFRKTYGIPFPLFPDADFSIHKKLGGVRTPYFIALKIGKAGKHDVLYSKPGALEAPDAFLEMLVSHTE